jgi:hypothetical protein
METLSLKRSQFVQEEQISEFKETLKLVYVYFGLIIIIYFCVWNSVFKFHYRLIRCGYI